MEKKSILKGTMIIAIVGLIARFIGLFFRIPLTALIGEEGIGIYSFPMTLFVPLTAIVMQGPPTTISKMIAQKVASKDLEGVQNIYQASHHLMTKMGLLATLIMLLLTPLFTKVIWSEAVLYPYLALSIAPMFLAKVSVYNGYHQGHQNMFPVAMQQLFDGIGRLVVGLVLAFVLIEKGVIPATTGAVLGTTFGALSGLIALLIFTNNKSSSKIDKSLSKSIQKQILKISTPITIGAIGASLIPLVDALLLPSRLGVAGFSSSEAIRLNGVLSNINALINVPLIIGVAISLNVVPNIAAVNVSNKKDIRSRMRIALILSIALALPSGIGLMLVGKSLFSMLYPNMMTNHYLVEILSISIIFTMINQTLIAILQGLDLERVPVKNFYIGMVFKLILSFTLLSIPSINIHGAAISTLIAYIIILILNYRSCKKSTEFKMDTKYMLIVPFFNTTIMSLGVVLTMICLQNVALWLTIFTSILVAVMIYGILLISTKTVTIGQIPILNRIKRH